MVKLTLTLGLILWMFAICNAQNTAPNFDWQKFVSVEGKFTTSFPAPPIKTVEEQITSAGKLSKNSFVASVTDPEIYFGVIYADLINPPAVDEALKNRYDFIRDKFIQDSHYQILNERDVRIGERVGRELVMKDTDIIIYYQTFIIGARSFQVIVTTDESSAKKPAIKNAVEKFLTAFQPMTN